MIECHGVEICWEEKITWAISVNLASYSSTVRPSSVPDSLPSSASTSMPFAWAREDMFFVYNMFSSKGRWEPSTMTESNPWKIKGHSRWSRELRFRCSHSSFMIRKTFWYRKFEKTTHFFAYHFKSTKQIMLVSPVIIMDGDRYLSDNHRMITFKEHKTRMAICFKKQGWLEEGNMWEPKLYKHLWTIFIQITGCPHLLFKHARFCFSYAGSFCCSNAACYQRNSTLLQGTRMNLNNNHNKRG